MTPETLEQFGALLDEAFFIIGGAILAIELLKGLFTPSFRWRGYADMFASFSTQIPFLLMEIFVLTFAYAGYVLIADTYVSWQMPITIGTAALAVLVADFVYYWEHRFAHEWRALWTQHAVHHSSRFMNISVAFRFGPLEGVTSAIFHLPMLFLGFPAELIFFSVVAVQAYQTWIHTELIGKLGPLDSVLNTPANHRVHHGCDEKYIDKNYGGILIIWDRLFGTYQPEEETPRYGLKRDFDSVHPLVVWFSELPKFFQDLRRARSFKERWMHLFGPPGWAPSPANDSAPRPAATAAE
ncbi:MAG: sterol desaturase family protein [Pseudomonadota bacterium]